MCPMTHWPRQTDLILSGLKKSHHDHDNNSDAFVPIMSIQWILITQHKAKTNRKRTKYASVIKCHTISPNRIAFVCECLKNQYVRTNSLLHSSETRNNLSPSVAASLNVSRTHLSANVYACSVSAQDNGVRSENCTVPSILLYISRQFECASWS